MKIRSYFLVFSFIYFFCCLNFAKPQVVRENKTSILFNRNKIIPIQGLENKKLVLVVPDKQRYASLVDMTSRYADIQVVGMTSFAEDTKLFNTLLIAGTGAELSQSLLLEAQQAAANGKEVILCSFSENFGNLSTQAQFGGRLTELIAVGSNRIAQEDMAMSLFGGLAIKNGLTKNQTVATRIQYAADWTEGDLQMLTRKIDAIAQEGLQERAAPGMVVLAIKDGKLLFEKAYGYHTYEGVLATRVEDIFDLASVSKIAGTTPVIMHLQETGKVDLNKTIGDYLWDAKSTNKAAIPLKTVLLHEAGFIPYIPFYKNLKPTDLQHMPLETHQVKLADGVYLRNGYYKNVMWPQMLNSAVNSVGNYVYSDISMYVMKEVAEQVTSTAMDQYIVDLLYKPIGMKTAGYNPRNRFSKERIVPTEHDTSFRKVLLEGYVHDQGAAMAGGVAGHAGLFGSANDLAIYGQLLLNRGTYGGRRFFKSSTIDYFTSRQSATSRRGLGFDRFDPNAKNGYPSKLANASVYGHTGYTGTCLWVDPQNKLVYIFLSNRVHPQVSTKLLDLNIRGRIQDAIYETFQAKK